MSDIVSRFTAGMEDPIVNGRGVQPSQAVEGWPRLLCVAGLPVDRYRA